MPMNTITELTQANGFLDATGDLTNANKELGLERMHSKFLGHHLLKLLSNSARQAIKKSDIYMWSTLDGIDEEFDGMTLLALILGRIHPNFKVDIYTEIGKVKKLTIAHMTMTFSCFLMQPSISNFRLIRRTLLHTLKMHSFGISSFSSSIMWYHHFLQHPRHTHCQETMKAAIHLKGMGSTIWSITKSCKTCQMNKRQTRRYGMVPSKIMISTPWEALCVNLVGLYTLKGKAASAIDTLWFLP